jgi:hypothetical protein
MLVSLSYWKNYREKLDIGGWGQSGSCWPKKRFPSLWHESGQRRQSPLRILPVSPHSFPSASRSQNYSNRNAELRAAVMFAGKRVRHVSRQHQSYPALPILRKVLREAKVVALRRLGTGRDRRQHRSVPVWHRRWLGSNPMALVLWRSTQTEHTTSSSRTSSRSSLRYRRR